MQQHPRPGHGQRRAEQRARRGDHRGFRQERTPHGGTGEADRAQQPGFAQPLLDAEAEEQAGQQQRGQHDEEREVAEVLAEVGGAGRGPQRLGARGAQLEPVMRRGQPREQLPLQRVAGRGFALRRRREADRGQPPEPVAEQRLRRGEVEVRLRRRAVLVPVRLVLRADRAEVERERRVPVGEVRRAADAGVLGGQVAACVEAGDRDHAREPEARTLRLDAPLFPPQEELDLDRVAWLRVQLARRPVVDEQRRRLAGGGCGQRRVGCHGGDQRVRHAAPADPDVVGEVGQHLLGAGARGAARRAGRGGDGVGDEATRVLERQRSVVRHPQPQPEVLEPGRGGERRVPVPVLGGGHQHGVGLLPPVEAALHERERREQHERVLLARPQRECAQLRALQHARDVHPQRGAERLLAPEQRRLRDVGRGRQPCQHRVADGGAQLARQRRADPRLARRRSALASLQVPEAFVDAEHLDPARAPPRSLLHDGRVERDHRRRGVRPAQLPGQRLAEEARRLHDVGHLAERKQRARAQAVAHRGAEQARAAERRHRDGDAEHRREVRARVEAQAGACEETHAAPLDPPRTGA